jgi:Predicted metal-binding integral membrane protein
MSALESTSPPRLQSLGTRQGSVLLAAAAVAWFVTVALASGMGAMPGTMGFGVVGFVGVWTLMMAAMMLPSIAPLTDIYLRTFGDRSLRRSVSLAFGYLMLWAVFGLVAFGVAASGGRLASDAPGWAHVTAVAVCVLCGVYQMTPLKDRCLAHCRTPLGHVLRYRAMTGRFVDWRVGVSHGAWCVACCWSLMAVLLAFGAMNLTMMLVLTGVILVEKLGAPGRWFSVLVGVAALALAVAVAADPALAPGLHVTTGGMHLKMGGS